MKDFSFRKIRERIKNIPLFIILGLVLFPFLFNSLSSYFINNIFFSFLRNLSFYPPPYYQQIKELKETNLKLKLSLKEAKTIIEENKILRSALTFSKKREIKILPAEVVYYQPYFWQRRPVINVGRKNKVRKGMYVIDERGRLVGKIDEVKKSYSSVILVSDRSFSLPVYVAGKYLGLLKGGLAKAKVHYLEKDSNISLKDKIITYLPPFKSPFFVGEVSRIRKDKNKLFLDVEAEIPTLKGRIFYLFVILTQ